MALKINICQGSAREVRCGKVSPRAHVVNTPGAPVGRTGLRSLRGVDTGPARCGGEGKDLGVWAARNTLSVDEEQRVGAERAAATGGARVTAFRAGTGGTGGSEEAAYAIALVEGWRG